MPDDEYLKRQAFERELVRLIRRGGKHYGLSGGAIRDLLGAYESQPMWVVMITNSTAVQPPRFYNEIWHLFEKGWAVCGAKVKAPKRVRTDVPHETCDDCIAVVNKRAREIARRR